MVPSDLGVGLIHRIRFATDTHLHPAGLAGQPVSYLSDRSQLRVGDEVYAVRPTSFGSSRTLDTVTRAGSALWSILVPSPDAREVEVHVRVFPGDRSFEAQPLVVGVDDRANDDVRRRVRNIDLPDADVRAWLHDEFVLGAADGRQSVVSGTLDGGGGIVLVGRRHAAFLAPDHESRLSLRDLAPFGSRDLPPLGLLTAPAVTFADRTHATEIAQVVFADATLRSQYLNLWDAYNRATMRLALRQAQRVGAFPYHRRTREHDGWQFVLHAHAGGDDQLRWERLGDVTDAVFEAAPTLPPHLGASAPTTEALFVDGLREHATRTRGGWSGLPESADWATGTVFLRTPPSDGRRQPNPPEQGFLFLSLRGDVTQVARRKAACEAVGTGAIGLPHLRSLIEGNTGLTSRPRRSVPSLSDAAVGRFGGEPTRTQRRAVQIALETPDLVLIQGPPGTGKTRVIAAIQAELAERAASSRWMSGQVLIASAQHDAVDNVAAASEVHGLPAVRVGKRFREKWTLSKHAAAWAAGLADDLDKKVAALPGGGVLDAIRTVRTAAATYRVAPGWPDEAEAIVRRAYDAAHPYLAPTSRTRLADAVAQAAIVSEEAAPPASVLDALAGLSNGESDPTAAQRVVRWTPSDLISPRDSAVIQGNADSPADATAAVARLVAQRIRLAPRPDPSVVTTLSEALDELVAFAESHVDGVHEALADLAAGLRRGLRQNEQVEDALRHYTVSLAATCSQSGGKAMTDAKQTQEGTLSFATVIVDEAARANPLDLFIPMAMAGERIVLVGDQNQLPQLLEPEVEDEIAAVDRRSDGDAGRSARENSLFEILFRRLSDPEGPQRVITLDAQYRMHEVLGQFVSDSFYPDIDLKSPRGREGFDHGLTGYGTACAAWLDVPFSAGAEEPRWRRPAEARRIAEEIALLLRDPAGMTLSVGVISFYSQQVRALEDALEDIGVWARTASGYRLAPDCAGDPLPGHRRLEVGTVDAFQGKEHDVVVLSLTRSNQVRLPQPGAEDFEKRARWKYGFLTLPNRLCVAMSRQKRLLVVAGDAAMADAAGDAVPALAAFRDLTAGPDGVQRT